MKKRIIKKGKHCVSGRFPRFWYNKKRWSFSFSFDNSCWYPEGSIKHEGVNKILGLSFGTHAEDYLGKIPFLKKFVNSIVIGWQPNYHQKNLFDICIIIDNKGEEFRIPWTNSTQSNKINIGFIERKGGEVYLQINNVGRFFSLNDIGFGYYLDFYHGGKSPAPQDMFVQTSIDPTE